MLLMYCVSFFVLVYAILSAFINVSIYGARLSSGVSQKYGLYRICLFYRLTEDYYFDPFFVSLLYDGFMVSGVAICAYPSNVLNQ